MEPCGGCQGAGYVPATALCSDTVAALLSPDLHRVSMRSSRNTDVVTDLGDVIVAARVNGEVRDLDRPITDADVRSGDSAVVVDFVTAASADGRQVWP